MPYFINVFQLDFNPMTMYLSTIKIHNRKTDRVCLGVLLDRNRVAFPEHYWSKDAEILACIFCKEGKEKLS